MQWFKNKKQENDEEANEPEEKLDIHPHDDLNIQVTKLGAKVESLLDIRKSYSEKFSMLSEQIGELRGMILDASKQIQVIEVKATKTIEVVKEVEPEKLLKEVRKQEQKIEAVTANLDSHQAIMNDITEELKKIRKQMEFYRGIEQVTKLHEDIMKDLINIKKVQSIVERHADKVESIFIDLQKKYGELDSYAATLEEVTKNNKEVLIGFDKVKIDMESKADKKIIDDLSNRVSRFIAETQVSEIKQVAHQVDKFSQDALVVREAMKKLHEKVNELDIVVESANLHTVKVSMTNVEKSLSLLQIELMNQKQVMKKLTQQQEKSDTIDKIIKEQSHFKKQLQDLQDQVLKSTQGEKTQAKPTTSASQLHKIQAEVEEQKREMQKLLTQMTQRMQKMDKNLQLKPFTVINKELGTLQKTINTRGKKK